MSEPKHDEVYDKRYAEEMPEIENSDVSMKAFVGKPLDEIIEEHDPTPPAEKLEAEWVERDRLLPNDWNPNFMPDHIEEALVLSILDNGWTAPILAKSDDTIVDGEHRWRISGHPQLTDREDLTPEGVPAGHVPVHYVDMEREQAMLATYQQNYARGEDNIVALEELVSDLYDDEEEETLQTRMGVFEGELEHLLPDTKTSVVDSEDLGDAPWEKPWDDDAESEMSDGVRYGKTLRLDMLKEETDLVEWLFGGDATNLHDLAEFVSDRELEDEVVFK